MEMKLDCIIGCSSQKLEEIYSVKNKIDIIDFKIEELKSYIKSVREELSKKRSETDQKVNGLYHQIENTKFNASQGYKLAKHLQDALKERREMKDLFAHTDHVISRLKTINP